jgi:mannan endo-1,4-beta-mannosidase
MQALVATVCLLVLLGDALAVATVGPQAPPGFLVRRGDHLVLDGRSFRFTGVNAYELATDWTRNVGCGAPVRNLDSLFAGLHRDSVVRFWAFEQLATDRTSHHLEWADLDRVVAAAAAHQVKLVMTLSNQSGSCDDGHWHDSSWYEGGFTANWSGGALPLPYSAWVTAVVTRYARSAAIAMWEPVNEPEASDCSRGFSGGDCYSHKSCPADATQALRHFFDVVGAVIHRLDRWHPVSSGTIGGAECGAAGNAWATVAGSPGLDVLDTHDYNVPAWNDQLELRTRQAASLGRPLVVEEWADTGPDLGSCVVRRDIRADALSRKVRTVMRRPVIAGFLLWNWEPPDDRGGCASDVTAGDPAMAVLASLWPA